MRLTIRFIFLVVFCNAFSHNILAQNPCGCTFVISLNAAEWQFDGIAKGVKPGDKICFASGTRSGIALRNIIGTQQNPVIITNMCDGKVTISASITNGNAVSIEKSSFYRVTGSGNANEEFGFEIKGGQMGINNQYGSTNFEIDHLNINNVGCVGIVAKTDPTCDPATWRGNFTLRNAILHDNKISNTGCEGFYVGNSHYDGGKSLVCNGQNVIVNEHDIDNVQIYNNDLRNIGADGIQVGSSKNTVIHHNYVYNVGQKNNPGHLNSIQVGGGSHAIVYNNLVDTGLGFGLYDTGGGGTWFNNIVMNIQQGAMLLQDTPPNYAPTGFRIFNNTFIDCKEGVFMYSEHPDNSYFYNNILIGQQSVPNFKYINLNNPPKIKWIESNNIKTQDVTSIKFVNPSGKDFHLLTGSAAIDGGKDVSGFGINNDYDENPRPKGSGFDIGAYEFQTGGPTSNAGSDKNITLPTNSIILNGAGTSSTGITGYLWTKKSGGVATLTNETTANLSVAGMVAGTYVFEFRVIDASGFAFDEVTVNVLPLAANQNPVANAGGNKTITLPTNTTILNGIGTDADGSIASYLWTKVSGPAATLTNANTPNLSLSGLVQGVYVFQLTVTDNNSATASAQATVTVNAAATNQIPLVNAGSQKTVFLPTNQVVITATASDPDGTISTILWEKKSGGTATLTNSNTLTLTASNLAAGSYTFRITVTDDKGATNFSEVLVTVIQANQSPTANAGADQAITLPTNSVVLAGSGLDLDGSIIGYAWTKVSGPAAALTNTNTATLTVSSMVQGIYVFGLTVTDNNGATGNDQVIVSVNSATPGPNEIPIALAGGNISFSLPTNSVNLFGAGFDPDGAIVSYAWTKASGGSALLTNADKPTLTVTNLQAGQYTFRLTVTDNAGATDDDIAIVTVSALGTNVFPVASAGLDKIVKLPLTSVTLIGSGTDEDGQIVSYSWTQTSGSSATIASPTTSSTTISGLAEGGYTFRLTVTDNSGATDLNEVTVRVVTSTSNLPPVVDAGLDIKIFSPQNTLIINSTASDDGTIVGYQWVKLSGPTVTLLNPSEQNLSLKNLVEGEYSFQLTVTDNNGASVFDIVKVSLLPATFNPPVADAGIDKEITLPINQVSLIGTASSPSGSIVSTVWTKTLGPAVTLTGATTLNLQCSNMVAGTYVFKLTATDNAGKEVSDNVQVIVNPIPPNQIPVVSAGQNYSLILPTSEITLTGTASDTDGSVSSIQWSLVSGPNSPTLKNTQTLILTASNLVEGLYIFRLSATDNEGAIGFNDALVFISNLQNSTNQPPISYAGEDIILIYPENSITIEGEGVAPGTGFISDYTWEQVQGQATSFISAQQFLHITDLNVGEYSYRLTVSDTLLSAFDEVKVTVIESSNEIPKFFSPNGDGYGETWVVRNIDSYQTCDLVVFSRSGQNVLQTRAYQNNWDGTYNGKRLADGDYYYVFNCDDGRKIKGALRIIR